jgi:transcriptional regulator with XRE-family HTH domain
MLDIVPRSAVRVRNIVDAGAVIRDARMTRGWSQSELAERIGVVRQTVAALERGAGVGLDVFIRAATLGVDLIAMASGSTPPGYAGPPAGAVVDLDAVLADVGAHWTGQV